MGSHSSFCWLARWCKLPPVIKGTAITIYPPIHPFTLCFSLLLSIIVSMPAIPIWNINFTILWVPSIFFVYNSKGRPFPTAISCLILQGVTLAGPQGFLETSMLENHWPYWHWSIWKTPLSASDDMRNSTSRKLDDPDVTAGIPLSKICEEGL